MKFGGWGVAAACLCLTLARDAGPDSRSVTFSPPAAVSAEPFEPSQSAALFVGVGKFTHDSIPELRFTVNDAIDLAYALSIDRRAMPFVPPDRVALALSSEPEKIASQKRLQALRAAGASVSTAGNSDILKLLQTQANRVGQQGILVIGFASHGFTGTDKREYLVASDSLWMFERSLVLVDDLLDVAQRVPRALVFIDACRTKVGRSVGVEEAASSLQSAIGDAAGVVLFRAASAGEAAYEDGFHQNGVFTAAVLEGLHCKAATDARGFVTARTLGDFVDKRVAEWIRRNRRSPKQLGIQVTVNGASASFPIAACQAVTARASPGQTNVRPADLQPMTVRPEGKTFGVYNAAGEFLWSGFLRGTVMQGEAEDLDGDGTNEVIIGVGGKGDDVGKIFVYNAPGDLRWSAATTAKLNYGSPSGLLAVKAFAIGDLYRTGKKQIVSISLDSHGWFPSRLCIFERDGKLRSSYWHPGHLHHVVIGAETANHEPRIFVSGVNNDLKANVNLSGYLSSVFALDPKAVAGEAPPYHGKSARGTHLWYGVIRPGKQVVERLEVVDFDQDGHQEISIWSSSGNVFYMSFDGKVVTVARADDAGAAARFEMMPR